MIVQFCDVRNFVSFRRIMREQGSFSALLAYSCSRQSYVLYPLGSQRSRHSVASSFSERHTEIYKCPNHTNSHIVTKAASCISGSIPEPSLCNTTASATTQMTAMGPIATLIQRNGIIHNAHNGMPCAVGKR